MSQKRYVGSFEVTLSGEYIPRDLSTKTIEPGKVIMVIDEFSKRIYLWLGEKSSQSNKMSARRAVKTIPTFGLRAAGLGFPIGRDCKIVEVDESAIESDDTTRSHLTELQELLMGSYKKITEGVWYASEIPPEAKEGKPEAQIVENRMLFEMRHLEKEAMGKDKKKKGEQ
jgi:hypothetical protein